MARLLRDKDYLRVIQSDNLGQVIEENNQTKIDVEQSAQSEMIGYLKQRYLTDQIFSNTAVFSITDTYDGKALVEWTEPAYDPTATYSTGDYVSFEDKIYKSIAGNAPKAFDDSEWSYIEEDKELFNVTLPYDEYVNYKTYVQGDKIMYDNIEYTALRSACGIAPTNIGFWEKGLPYSINTIRPDDNTKWTKGDNRNQQIVLYLLDITLYHLHSRINPRNIPELRKERYDGNSAQQQGGAIGYLKKVAKGHLTADLPQVAPQQGMAIRFGSAVPKQINTY